MSSSSMAQFWKDPWRGQGKLDELLIYEVKSRVNHNMEACLGLSAISEDELSMWTLKIANTSYVSMDFFFFNIVIPSSQGYGFSSSHVWTWELDCEESWALKNWCCWTMMLEKTLESPLDCKEVQPAHSEGDQPWDFFGRNDAKAETPVLWPPHAKSWLTGKDPDAGRDWGQDEKGTKEGEMAGWHHRLDGREFEWALGVGDGQGGLASCSSWDRKESDTTEQLNWTES